MKQTLPENMRAIAIESPGGPDVLKPVTVPLPEPRQGEVLVRVAAAGVNRPDCLQRQGRYPVPADASPLPGLEISGRVVAAGPGLRELEIGDAVMALVHGGGYAGYCRVHETHCLPVPKTLSPVEAAAVPETFFTVWYNLFMRARLSEGETLLVHGGTSGIGTTAIQLAKAFGATVLATAGNAAKRSFAESLGAERAFDYHGDWAGEIREHTGGAGVDVVLDMVAGDYAQKHLDLLARDGRYAIIAFLGGSKAELDLKNVVTKRLTLSGSTLRPQSVAEKAAIRDGIAGHVLPLLERGDVRPVIDSTFALDDARSAHARMESGEHIGKIVLLADEQLELR